MKKDGKVPYHPSKNRINQYFLLIIALPLTILLITKYLLHFSTKITCDLIENVTVLSSPKIITESLPNKVSCFPLRKPIPLLNNYEPVYLKGASKYKLSLIALYNTPFYVVMKDVIASSENVIFANNSLYSADLSCNPRYWNWDQKNRTNVVVRYRTYDSLITIGHQHSSDFGHWLLEVLPAFAAIPKSVRDKSYFIIMRMPKHVEDSLRFFGFNISRVIQGRYANARGLMTYTIWTNQCGFLNQWLLSNFRSIVVLKLHLDTEKPKRYVLFNRNKGQSRYLSNFNELVLAAKEMFPLIHFEVGKFYATFVEQVVYFNSMKFVFAVHGSLLSNIIFMQELTIVVELQMEKVLPSFFYASIITGKVLVCLRDRNISYRSTKPNVGNITAILDAFSVALQ